MGLRHESVLRHFAVKLRTSELWRGRVGWLGALAMSGRAPLYPSPRLIPVGYRDAQVSDWTLGEANCAASSRLRAPPASPCAAASGHERRFLRFGKCDSRR